MIDQSNLEAEKAVLAAILNFRDAYGEIVGILTENHFSDYRHQAIFKAMAELDMEGEPIDMVTVRDKLESQTNNWKSGGYIAEIVTGIASAANIKHYAKIVYESWVKRQIISRAQTAINQCRSGGEVKAITDELAEGLFDLQPASRKSQPTWIGDILPATLKEIEENRTKSDGITGLPWPWIDLNNRTAGLHPGDLTIIGGRPGMGKTIVGLNVCQNLAVKGKICLFISAEMQKEQLVMRCIASEAMVNGHHLRAGRIDDQENLKIANIAGKLKDWNLIIDDTSAPSLPAIANIARRIQYKYGLDLICIDHLRLLTLPRGDNLHQQVGEATRIAKCIAKDMKLPVILIHQLSRGVELRKVPRPQLSDLKESGDVEQNADNVIFIYRPEVYGIKKIPGPHGLQIDSENVAELIIAKQRNGETSAERLTFQKPWLRFVDYYKEG